MELNPLSKWALLICNKDTLKTIVATTTAIGAGVDALVFSGVQTLINNHCKKES